MPNLSKIIEQVQKARKQANTANQKRYEQLLGLLNDLQSRTEDQYDQMMAQYSQFGQRARREALEREQQRRGDVEQDLISRGLGNTTIRNTALRDVDEQTQQRLQDISEAVATQRADVLGQEIGTDVQTTGMLAGAVEGRQDVGPQMSEYARLIQQAAANRGGGVSAAVSQPPPPMGVGGGAGGGGGQVAGGQSGFGERSGGGAPASGARLVKYGGPADFQRNIEGLSGLAAAQAGADPGGGAASGKKKKKEKKKKKVSHKDSSLTKNDAWVLNMMG